MDDTAQRERECSARARAPASGNAAHGALFHAINKHTYCEPQIVLLPIRCTDHFKAVCCTFNSEGHSWWKEQVKTNPLSCIVCEKPAANNYCTNSATYFGSNTDSVLHLHLNFCSFFNVVRQLSRSTVLGSVSFRQDVKGVRIALSRESKVHTAQEELITAQSKLKYTNSFTFSNFITKNEARGNAILP